MLFISGKKYILKKNKFKESLEDCEVVLMYDKNNEKAIFRKTQALFALGDISQSRYSK
jgi:hypothetical protein